MSSLTGLVFSKTALSNLSGIPPKMRSQLIKKAKALILDRHPQGSKQLKGIRSDEDEVIYRQRSGDYRILYVVRQHPTTVIVLDIGHRKDVYR